MMGSMDTFVPGQYVYWITCHFTRQVVGTAMAVSGGWDASEAGFVHLFIWEREIVERHSTEILVIFTIFYQKCTIVNIRLD
jgi:hypothetical protein